MIFKLFIDPNAPEEIVANVHARTPLVDEIERMVSSNSAPDPLPAYHDDEITLLALDDIECFIA